MVSFGFIGCGQLCPCGSSVEFLQGFAAELNVMWTCCWRRGRSCIRSGMISWKTWLLPPVPKGRGEEISRCYQLNSCSSDRLLTPLPQNQTVPVCLVTLPLGNNTTGSHSTFGSPLSWPARDTAGITLHCHWDGWLPWAMAALSHWFGSLLGVKTHPRRANANRQCQTYLTATTHTFIAYHHPGAGVDRLSPTCFSLFFFPALGELCSQRSKYMYCWWTL